MCFNLLTAIVKHVFLDESSVYDSSNYKIIQTAKYPANLFCLIDTLYYVAG